jgi:hypothetical protein
VENDSGKRAFSSMYLFVYCKVLFRVIFRSQSDVTKNADTQGTLILLQASCKDGVQDMLKLKQLEMQSMDVGE